MSRRRSGLGSLALGLLVAAAADAAVLRFPGPPPCGPGTCTSLGQSCNVDGDCPQENRPCVPPPLQDCLDGAASGDTIEIRTNTPIDISAPGGLELADKSLELRPAPGFMPFLTGNDTTQVVSVLLQTPPDTGDGGPPGYTVTLTGLTLSNVQLAVSVSAGVGNQITIDGCQITHGMTSTDARGIDLDIEAPTSVLVRRNTVTTTGKPIRVFTKPRSGDVDVTVLGNVLSGGDSLYSSTGIYVDTRGAGTATVDLYSNVVHDLTNCNCFGAAGIEVSGSETATATVNIVNNTLHDAKSITVHTPTSMAQLLVNVFNNIVNKSADYPLRFPARSSNLAINNNYNDLVGAKAPAYGGYSAGSANRTFDPSFVGNGNFHLRSTSALKDAGSPPADLPPDGLPLEDADGNNRVAGPAVDMGAYEFGSSPYVPTTTSTTTVTTRTTVTTTSTVTSTTLPVVTCAPVPTFDDIACRLDALAARVRDQVPAGPLRDKLLGVLAGAKPQVDQAAALLPPGDFHGARVALGKATRAVTGFVRLMNRRPFRTLPATLRAGFRKEALELRQDLATLKGNL